MPLLVPDVGEIVLLDVLRAWFLIPNIEVGLYASAHTPAAADVLSDYTAIEATFPNYARIVPVNWTAAIPDGAGRATTMADFCLFVRGAGGSPEDIFGYFVVDTTGPELLWAEEDPNAPVAVNINGATYAVRPRLTLRSEF